MARVEVRPPASPVPIRQAPIATRVAPAVVASQPRPASTLRQVSHVVVAPRPRGDFVRVVAGEKLDDVARRVYGPGADPKVLWRSNRDQIASADAPLEEGMTLRTPWP